MAGTELYYTWRVDLYWHDNYTGGSYTHTYKSGKNFSGSSSYVVGIDLVFSAPTRTGYNFLGYTRNSDGSGTVYHSGDVYSISFSGSQTKSVDFYAKWQKKTYTISYNANGGIGAPSSQTKTYGTNLTLSSTRPTRDNYIFQGWATSQDGPVVYQPGGTYSDNVAVTLYAVWKVAAATLSSVSNTAIESSGTAAWTKILNTDAYKLKITFGNAPQVTVNVPANSASCSFTIPSTWYQYFPSATSGTATAVLETYTDANYTTLVGSSSKTFKVSVASSIKPSISAFTAAPHSSNATVEGWGIGVQGYSYFTLAATATPGTGASISGIEFSGPSISYSGTATSKNTGIVTDTGTVTFTVKVTDSRGRSSTKTVSKTVYEYSNPIISSLTAVRCLSNGTESDIEGNYIKAKPVFTFSSANGKNSLSVKKIEYKLHSGSSWTTVTTSAASGSWTSVFGVADITKTYDVKCTITDAINNTFAIVVQVPPVVGFAIGLNNDRARFGGPVEKAGLQVDWDAEFNGFVDVVPRRCNASLSSEGWYRILKMGAPSCATSRVIDIAITRTNIATNNESHCIRFIGIYNNFSFVNELSKSNTQIIDKIRYAKDDSYGYIDIHYAASARNSVHADFEVSGSTAVVKLGCVAESLQDVTTLPADVTVVTTYDFNADGTGDINVNGAVTGQGFADLLFGIGNTIASNTDCDSITTEGKYTCPTSVVGSTLTNPPYTSAFGMLVLRVAESTRLVQIAMPNSTSITMKLRYFNGTTWTAWKTLTPS